MGKASRRKRERTAWGPGILLGDEHRYYRVADLPRDHPLLERKVKRYTDDGAVWEPIRDDLEMLVAR